MCGKVKVRSMLLSKEVEVKINKKNLDWYKSKGYNCELRDIITINVSDLVPNSRLMVEYRCDECNSIKEIAYTSFTKRHKNKDNHYCVECANKIIKNNKIKEFLAKDGFKKCRKCSRILPANTDYFYASKESMDGFIHKCKECHGKKFTEHLIKIPKEGYKFCIKCDRELEVSIKYFPPDKSCKDGFRNVCRECGADGHFMKDNYKIKHNWTFEEDNLLIQNYKHYTNYELIDLFFPSCTRKSLSDRACKLGISGKTEETINRKNEDLSKRFSGENSPLYGTKMEESSKIKLSNSLKKHYKNKDGWWLGKKRSYEQRMKLSERNKSTGFWKGSNNPQYGKNRVGELNPNWQGGKTQLYFELRTQIQDWKDKSIKSCNYKCVITGGEFHNIHHLYSFRKIVDECFDYLNIDIRNTTGEYSVEEFNEITQKLNQLHDNYGLGICLNKYIHKLFHDLYGYRDNTKEQFKDFKIRLKNGEFDEFLKENNLNLCI